MVHQEPRGDDRGFFARAFCREEFAAQGVEFHIAQANNSLSAARGTLRGMHYQLGRAAETKLVRCIRGAVWDCVLDLRSNSRTFGQWHGEELSAENRKAMLCPKGFAHGFITLTDQAEVFYFVDEVYSSELERGVRWNDPRFAIDWPLEPTVISERDQKHPDFEPACRLLNQRVQSGDPLL